MLSLLLLALPAFALLSYALARWERSVLVHFTKELPWSGLRKEFYPIIRASFRQLLLSPPTLTDGYARYGKKGQPFAIPDPSFKPQVMLPQEHVKWINQQSAEVLSLWTVRDMRNALGYMNITVDHKSTINFTEKVIGRCLTRNLDAIQTDVYAEIRTSVDDLFGLDTDSWRELNGHETMNKIADRTGIRAMFGLALCRDQNYMHNLARLNKLMGMATILVGRLPPVVRNIAGNLVSLPIRYYKAKVMRTLEPFIAKQMEDFDRHQREGVRSHRSKDFLTQAVATAMTNKDRTVCNDAPYLAEQFILLSFAALATMSLVSLNVFFDLSSAPSELDAFNVIREEAAQIFTSDQSWTSPAALHRLKLPASAIRESLRLNPIQLHALVREVMPKDGIRLPDGTSIAKGTWIGVPAQAVHLDERFYDNPLSYDPFRFAREQEKLGKEKADATQPSDTFLGFSYGRHACPGRWFAEQFLKLLLAYVAVHYEVEPLAQRPERTVFGDVNVPSLTTSLRVRRRKDV